MSATQAKLRIAYGTDASQFGDLWLPAMPAARHAPVVVLLHGGWWQSEYDLAYADDLCAALRAEGIAVWSLEYRRVGVTRGGWPATFEDVADGFDFLQVLRSKHPLDVTRVVAMGHSAGGHLAMWLAGRHHLPEGSALYRLHEPALPLHGVVSLAGAVDLRLTVALAGYFTFAHDKQEVYSLMGGSPAQFPGRYRAGNPGDLLPLNVPQYLIQGSEDTQIPPRLPERWAEMARRIGDTVAVSIIPGADHFDVVDPKGRSWPAVMEAVRALCFG